VYLVLFAHTRRCLAHEEPDPEIVSQASRGINNNNNLNKKFERQVRMQGRTLLQQMSDKSLPHPFTEEEISTALQKTKPATAAACDNILGRDDVTTHRFGSLKLP